LTPGEHDALERSLSAKGCRDALVLWGDVLVNGHNRYGIGHARHGRCFDCASGIIAGMRINLVTPFADKDKAKALGARWDSIRKVWYIVDVADLTPFMRWIPDVDLATSQLDMPSDAIVSNPAKKPTGSQPAVTTRSDKQVHSCDCKVLPWEDCDHTIARG
jgi:hypothetical protein